MQTLVILGFNRLVAGWFSMFFRVRRDHPTHDVGKYGSYIDPRVFGLFSRRTGLGLLWFYWEHYGLDARLAAASLAGLGLILLAIFSKSG